MPLPLSPFGGGSFVDDTYNGTRIELEDPDTIALTPFIGSGIVITRQPYQASQFAPLLSSSTLMDSDGTDTLTILPDAELLYVYACTSVAAFPMTLAASSTPPTPVGADWYLGTSGAELYARFVGCVYLIGGEFVDSDSARLVWNQWNRIQRRVFVCPNEAQSGTRTTYVVNFGTFAPINARTNDFVQFITGPTSGILAGDVAQLSLNVMLAATTTADAFFGIAIDNTGDAVVASGFAIGAQSNSTATLTLAFPSDNLWAHKTANMVAYTDSANVTLAADGAQNGSTFDPYNTYLSGLVYA